MKKPLHLVVSNAAEKSAKIYLYGIIGDYWTDSPLTADRFVRELTVLEGKGISRVDVHINSVGGSVFDGLGICNAIKSSKLDIHTWNDGLAASMGSAILCSAKTGKRHLAKQSVTMIHSASTIAWGNSQDMQDTADYLKTFDTVLAGFYSDASGKTVEEIQKQFFDYKDHWLSAQETEAFGFATVEDYESEAEVPENITNMSFDKVAALYKSNLPTNSQKTDMGLLTTNKFKTLSALAKVAVADLTADQLKPVQEEIEAEGIKGVSIVLDADLKETMDAAAKVEGLEAEIVTLKASADKVTGLEAQVAKIAGLEATIAEQKKKLDAVVTDPTAPSTEETDETPGDGKKDEEVLTAMDKEMNSINALFNLIP
ncbi:head maturation protease, ClpP-related [Paradesertivirga mongoliensis]|uniref:ATP-dependent Clp protease proteolytic subunit n=1 Tax=Paradesertivirga mongoliensis TaxID=2100740 RepID=A0ABW4ZP31_9SPHI|nr:head maturation protease, ClpP-related [Pedobacter mongoliensis]